MSIDKINRLPINYVLICCIARRKVVETSACLPETNKGLIRTGAKYYLQLYHKFGIVSGK